MTSRCRPTRVPLPGGQHESKYGYKWAEWVTRIELSDDADFRGFWESNAVSNSDDTGPAFD